MSTRVRQGTPSVRTRSAGVVVRPHENFMPIVGRPHDESLKQALLACVAKDIVTPRIAVIVPVLARPHRVAPLLESFRRATYENDAALYFVAQFSDTAEVEAIRAAEGNLILVDDVDRSWARKINRGYERTLEPWLLLGADDLAFRLGWVESVRLLLSSHSGVIGTNDLGNRGTAVGSHSTHPLVRRLYADVMGTADERKKVVHEGYDHNYPDTELVRTAQARGLYVHRTDCIIEHLHPAWGKGAHDATYARGQARMAEDSKIFHQRSISYGF